MPANKKSEVRETRILRRDRKPTKDLCKLATKPAMTEVAPGVFVPADEFVQVPEYTLAKYVETNAGHYRLVPVMEHMTRVNAQLIKMLGLDGQWMTLRRLADAGFIEMIKIAPGTSWLNLDSFYNHVRRCAEDPEFWKRDGGNFKTYREVRW